MGHLSHRDCVPLKTASVSLEGSRGFIHEAWFANQILQQQCPPKDLDQASLQGTWQWSSIEIIPPLILALIRALFQKLCNLSEQSSTQAATRLDRPADMEKTA